MKSKKAKDKTKYIALVFLGGVILLTLLMSRLFLTFEVNSNKMAPAYKKGSTVLVKKPSTNEKYKNGDVLIYESYLNNEFGIGRVISSSSIRAYISEDRYNNANGTTEVNFVLPLDCPEKPEINVETDHDYKCYTHTNLDELQSIGTPVMADSMSQNTWKRRFIVESPSNQKIKGRVLMCIFNCR